MSSDKKLLLQEYSRNPSFANWCINQLEPYHCLVLESGFKQELFTYTAPFEGNVENPIPASEDRNEMLELGNEDEELSDRDTTCPANTDEDLKSSEPLFDENHNESPE